MMTQTCHTFTRSTGAGPAPPRRPDPWSAGLRAASRSQRQLVAHLARGGATIVRRKRRRSVQKLITFSKRVETRRRHCLEGEQVHDKVQVRSPPSRKATGRTESRVYSNRLIDRLPRGTRSLAGEVQPDQLASEPDRPLGRRQQEAHHTRTRRWRRSPPRSTVS